MHCILPEPLVLVLILLGCIFSCLGSTYSNYVNILPILFSVFHPDPLHVLIGLVPFVPYLYQKCWTVLCFMVCCMKIHTCHRWLWVVSFIVPWLLIVMKNNCSSTSSKSSSSTTSSSESSYVSLIISTQCIILRSLIILWLGIIVLWWCSKLFLHYCIAVVLETIAHDYIVVIVHCYTMVVAHCYTADTANIVLLHVQPMPCMYLQYFISPSPRFYNTFLHVQLTHKSYKTYSLVLSNTSTLEGNDRDNSHVFFKSHIMVLLKLKDLAYPL
jgi:hypothetical protein